MTTSIHAAAEEMTHAVSELRAVGWISGAQQAAAIEQETLRLVATITELRRTAGELIARATALIDGSTSGAGPSLVRPKAPPPIRPTPEIISLTEDRSTHILDGENGRGGHRHGRGLPGKTEFPARWTDDTVTEFVLDVARRPERAEQQINNRWLFEGQRDGVTIAVFIEQDGRIVTAYPRPGGLGVVDNPQGGKK